MVDASSLAVGRELGEYVLAELIHDGSMPHEYQSIQKLGKGAYGVVWKCYKRTDLDRANPVAIKVMHPTASRKNKQQESDACKMLQTMHEKFAAAGEQSSVIMQCLDDQAMMRGYLVYEYLTGLDLEKAGASDFGRKQLRAHRMRMMPQLLDGIRVMSEVKVGSFPMLIHRDLKPANVMVDFRDTTPGDPASGTPVLKIIDFGLAALYYPDQPDSEARRKTPSVFRGYRYPYAPPEVNTDNLQFESCDSNGVSNYDVYSAGVLSYAMAVPGYRTSHLREWWSMTEREDLDNHFVDWITRHAGEGVKDMVALKACSRPKPSEVMAKLGGGGR